MSTPTMIDPHPVVAAIEAMDTAADTLCSGDVWQLPDGEFADSVTKLESMARRLFYGSLRVLAEFHTRGVSLREAGVSTQVFLQDRLRLSPAEASRRVRCLPELLASANLSGEIIPPQFPTTAAGVADGTLSAEHVQVVSQAIRKLPTSLPAVIRAKAEETLGTQARALDPALLGKTARRLHAHLDRDGTAEDDKPSRNRLFFHQDLDGGYDLRGHLDPELTALARAVLEPLAQPHPILDGVRDTRSKGRRMADALGDLLRFASSHGKIPTVAGEKPHIVVTINFDDLRDRSRGLGSLDTGDAVTPETARRLACEAKIIPMLLGSEGEPLDIGRATRAIPPSIRRAVITRDKGCVHARCPKPGTQIHHVQHWVDGGRTAAGNLVLLCDQHHWVVHHENWQVVFLDKIPHVIPPPIIDPLQRPRRNTMHDIPTLATP